MVKAVMFDFYNTLAETTNFGPSWEELVSELGYELPADVRERWWNDGIDGTEHDEHSISRDHYVAWQQSRVRSMLGECGVPDDAHDVFIERVREIGAHNRIDAYEEVAGVLSDLARAASRSRSAPTGTGTCTRPSSPPASRVRSTSWCRRRGSAPASPTRASTRTRWSSWASRRRTRSSSATPGRATSTARAAGMHTVYIRRSHLGVDHTAPEAHLLPADVHHALDLRAVHEHRSLQP